MERDRHFHCSSLVISTHCNVKLDCHVWKHAATVIMINFRHWYISGVCVCVWMCLDVCPDLAAKQRKTVDKLGYCRHFPKTLRLLKTTAIARAIRFMKEIPWDRRTSGVDWLRSCPRCTALQRSVWGWIVTSQINGSDVFVGALQSKRRISPNDKAEAAGDRDAEAITGCSHTTSHGSDGAQVAEDLCHTEKCRCFA